MFRLPHSIRTGIAALVLSLPALGAAADPVGQGRIRGTVRDLTRKPLAGLLVRLVAPGRGLVHVTNTDEKGIYAFEGLEAGPYDVEVSGSGFQRQIKKEILVRPPFRNIVDFSLPPGPMTDTEPASPVVYLPPEGEPAFREVTGLFTDKEKRPIPDVLVRLTNPVTAASFRARSDREGKIRIPEVPVGVYRVVISSPGYVAVELPRAEVSRARGLSLNLSLVEYPLNFDGRVEDLIPEERPVEDPGRPPAP
jgi:hypothetical protein